MMQWTDYFYYDESSPSCLRWKVNRYSGKGYKKLEIAAGDSTGKFDIHIGYYRVTFYSEAYLVHRLIWEIHNGVIPKELVIDHIDGDTMNNKLSNLRLVSKNLNSRNQRKRSKNSSGVTGVQSGEGRWVAFWQGGKKQKRKSFSISKYGDDEAFRLACEYRAKMVAQIGGYTERHGH